MADYRHDLQFGVFITPLAGEPAAVLELARLADPVGLELVTFPDHPYQPRFLDTWTVLSVVAAQTINVRVAPNVATCAAPAGRAGAQRRKPGRPQRRPRRAGARSRLLLGGDRGQRRGAAHTGAGRRCPRGGDRGDPRHLGHGRGFDPLRRDLLPDRRCAPRTGADARRRELARRLQAAHARAHRRQGRRLAAEHRLPRARPADGEQRRDRRSGGRCRPAARGDPADAQHQRHLRQRQRLPAGRAGRLGGAARRADADQRDEQYIVSAASADDVRRFAEEVAPAVRELVLGARGGATGDRAAAPSAPAAVTGTAAPLSPRATASSASPPPSTCSPTRCCRTSHTRSAS
jgi:hypothetical protein